MNKVRLEYLIEQGSEEELIEEFKNVVGKICIFKGKKKRVIGVQVVKGVIKITVEESERKVKTVEVGEFYKDFEKLL